MKDNLDLAVHQTMKLFDLDFPNSFNLLICNLVYNSFLSQKNTSDIFLSYLTEIQAKEEEMNKNNLKIIHMFVNYISKNKSQESNYLIEKMIEQNLIDVNIAKDIDSIYFAHYKTEKENIKRNPNDLFTKTFLENYEKLSKNNWSLHKKYIREGHKPNKIARIIRNDEIEKLQIISSLTHFDYDQFIKPSLYERCSFINQENVALIDYAAFFGSVKCFKYLLINNAKLENTGKYAVAGGNLEIIHLCEQNHSSFEGAYETVIEFHQNDIFKYLYENKLKKINNLNKLVYSCIINANYEILFFLEEEMKISDDIINTAVKIGNLYLVKYFIRKYQIPKNILILASWNNQIDIIKLLVEQTGIDINAKNNYGETALMCACWNNNIEIVKILIEHEGIDINTKNNNGETALIIASAYGCIEIVKLLLEQKGIDTNAKNIDGETALMRASWNNHREIVKFLVEQEGIDINIKNNIYLNNFLFQYNIWKLLKLFWTALMQATQNHNIEIVKILLEKNVIRENTSSR